MEENENNVDESLDLDEINKGALLPLALMWLILAAMNIYIPVSTGSWLLCILGGIQLFLSLLFLTFYLMSKRKSSESKEPEIE